MTVAAWTRQESARLTARLVVVDGTHLPADGLDEDEMQAICALALQMDLRRWVVAERIGWSSDRLRRWCSVRGIAWNETAEPRGY